MNRAPLLRRARELRRLRAELAAEQAERAHIERLLRGEPTTAPKDVPTFEGFVPEFLAIAG